MRIPWQGETTKYNCFFVPLNASLEFPNVYGSDVLTQHERIGMVLGIGLSRMRAAFDRECYVDSCLHGTKTHSSCT